MTTWFIADTHFSHQNILDFSKDGKSLRPFDDIESMNAHIKEMWNSKISPDDKVYHLGDVAFAVSKLKSLDILYELNGKKSLVLGNHDQYGKMEGYLVHFPKIYASYVFTIAGKRGILTHIPIHPDQLKTRFAFNIHGHLHNDVVDDPRYLCVSIEQNNLGPISKEEIEFLFKERGVL